VRKRQKPNNKEPRPVPQFINDYSLRSTTKRTETSVDELALTQYPVEEPETFADGLVFTSFSHPVEDNISADELGRTTYVKPIASKKRLRTGSKKTLSKDPRYGTGTSSRRRQNQEIDWNIRWTVEEVDFT
jgi:hypothetical protein